MIEYIGRQRRLDEAARPAAQAHWGTLLAEDSMTFWTLIIVSSRTLGLAALRARF